MASAIPQAARTIDCHLHVIGDGKAHPYVAGRGYDPEPATLAAMLAMHARWGIGRAVLVQVSVHGTDNSLLLEALRQGEGRFRGVAVVEEAIDDARLAAMAAAGIVGLRLNLAHGGGPGQAGLDRYGAICRELGWHLQLFVEASLLPGLGARLARLGIDLVLDHFGGLPASTPPSDPAFRAVAALVRDGAWVKLSAPYRISGQRDGFRDTVRLGQALLDLAPGRCVWGSDWPHVAADGKVIGIGELLELVPAMTQTGERTEALLFRNAERLYGFDPTPPE